MKIVLLLILAYLLGSIPSGLWIGKLFFHKNLHDYGSGNTGTTNTFRILGRKAGIIVFILDFFKGYIATCLPLIFNVHVISPVVFGILAISGHTCSIFDNFKGGKAVATSAGMLFAYNPYFFLFLLIVFAITLYLTSMVSFASVACAVIGGLAVLIFPSIHFIFKSYDLIFTILTLILAFFIIYKHKDNIKRIMNHDENLVPFGLNITKQKTK